MTPSRPVFTLDTLPDAVKVPAGQRVAMGTVGVSDITDGCKAKAGMADAFQWVFVGHKAALNDRCGQSGLEAGRCRPGRLQLPERGDVIQAALSRPSASRAWYSRSSMLITINES